MWQPENCDGRKIAAALNCRSPTGGKCRIESPYSAHPATEVSMDIALLVLFLVFFFWQTVTD